MSILPPDRQRNGPPTPPAGDGASTQWHRRVLIVDDDATIRAILAEIMVDEGYEVADAGNGSLALRLLEVWQADLILLDLAMPEMDGWAFLTEWRRREAAAAIPVVVVSSAIEDPVRLRAMGVSAVLPKPFNLEALVATIGRLTMPPADRGTAFGAA